MAIITKKAGELIYQPNEPLNSFDIIMNGSVRATFAGGEILLAKGDAIGLLSFGMSTHSFTYVAETPMSFLSYPFEQMDQFESYLESHQDLCVLLAVSMARQLCRLVDHYQFTKFDSDNLFQYIQDSYEEYKGFCHQFGVSAKVLPDLQDIVAYVPEVTLESWILRYYDSIRKLAPQQQSLIFRNCLDFCLGFLHKAADDVHLILMLCTEYSDYNSQISTVLLNSDKLDFFDLLTELYCKLARNQNTDNPVISAVRKLMLYLEGLNSIDRTLYESRVDAYQKQLVQLESMQAVIPEESHESNVLLQDSLNVILSFSECALDVCDQFRDLVTQYRDLTDKTDMSDETNTLRRKLTKLYYEVYTETFFQSLEADTVPHIVQMFLHFGYIDESIAGSENAHYLSNLCNLVTGNTKRGIYTLYEWLIAIYEGKKESSKNEFDTDFNGHVQELKTTRKITEREATEMLGDRLLKVRFELENMFPLVNKMVAGRSRSYCPIFSDHNLLRSLEDTLISAKTLELEFQRLTSLDYTAYYRETMYANPSIGITKEYIRACATPDFILMPTVGIQGVMWQEIEGKKRSTPSRMMLPIFCMTDLYAILIRLTGEFRWEICKRIQGGRWNDVTEPSLTSEYCDYLQFYRKNNDLSMDAKEKVKSALTRARNIYKEAFVQDYITLITSESACAPRLNKVARKILFQYCPFPSAIREQISVNPLYSEVLQRHTLKTNQALHHYRAVIRKVESTGNDIPIEIQIQMDLLNA